MSDDNNTVLGKLNSLESMVRLLLEQVQTVNERVNHMPTREELLAVKETAVAVEDRSETGYVVLESSLQSIADMTKTNAEQLQETAKKLDNLHDLVAEGFASTADSLQSTYLAVKAVSDKNELIDEDVRDLKRKFG